MPFFTRSILHEISRAWLDAWNIRRVAASGLSMSVVTLGWMGAMALARAAAAVQAAVRHSHEFCECFAALPRT